MTSLSLDLWDHPTSLRVSNETVWQKTAMNLAELHSTIIDGIDQSWTDTHQMFGISDSEPGLLRTSMSSLSWIFERTKSEPRTRTWKNVTNSWRTCPLNSDIDKEKYTRPYQGFMNSREIKHIFDWFYNFYENSAENIDEFLDVMGLTHEAWI